MGPGGCGLGSAICLEGIVRRCLAIHMDVHCHRLSDPGEEASQTPAGTPHMFMGARDNTWGPLMSYCMSCEI